MRDDSAPAPVRAGQLMTLADLCRELGCSPPWLRGVIADPASGFPAPIMLGRRRYYRRSHFCAWLDAKGSEAA